MSANVSISGCRPCTLVIMQRRSFLVSGIGGLRKAFQDPAPDQFDEASRSEHFFLDVRPSENHPPLIASAVRFSRCIDGIGPLELWANTNSPLYSGAPDGPIVEISRGVTDHYYRGKGFLNILLYKALCWYYEHGYGNFLFGVAENGPRRLARRECLDFECLGDVICEKQRGFRVNLRLYGKQMTESEYSRYLEAARFLTELICQRYGIVLYSSVLMEDEPGS